MDLIKVFDYLNICGSIKELNKDDLSIKKNELKTHYLFNELDNLEKDLRKDLNINEFKELVLYSCWYSNIYNVLV